MMALAATVVSDQSYPLALTTCRSLQLCNLLDEYVTGLKEGVKLQRSHELTAKEEAGGLDPNDRKNTGYVNFYNSMLAILEEMHKDVISIVRQ